MHCEKAAIKRLNASIITHFKCSGWQSLKDGKTGKERGGTQDTGAKNRGVPPKTRRVALTPGHARGSQHLKESSYATWTASLWRLPGPTQHSTVLLHADVVGVAALVIIVAQSDVDVADFEEHWTQTTDHHLRHVHEHHRRQHSRQKCIWHSVAANSVKRSYWFLSLRKILIVHDTTPVPPVTYKQRLTV